MHCKYPRPRSDDTFNLSSTHLSHESPEILRLTDPNSSSWTPFYGPHDRLLVGWPPPTSPQGSTPGTCVHLVTFTQFTTLFHWNQPVGMSRQVQWTVFYYTILSVTIVTTDSISMEWLFYGLEMIARKLKEISI